MKDIDGLKKDNLFRALSDAIVKGDQHLAQQFVQQSIKENINPVYTLQNSLIPAMDVVGKNFETQEFFLPEILIAARALETGFSLSRHKCAYIHLGLHQFI